MDISKIYHKMCNNPYIQKKWEPKEGDYVMIDKPVVLGTQVFGLPEKVEHWPYPIMKIAVPQEKFFIAKTTDNYHQAEIKTTEFILKKFKGLWLPRQDQIQQMMLTAYKMSFSSPTIFLVNNLFQHWLYSDIVKRPTLKVETLEQLWLAHYMDEIHDKEWNGKNWIKKKECNKNKNLTHHN